MRRSSSNLSQPRFIDGWSGLLLTAAGTFAAACLLVFLLPLHVPVAHHAMISASYVGGFNNAVAVVAAAGASVAVFLATLWLRRREQPAASWTDRGEPSLDARFIGIVVALSALVLAICGALIKASHLAYMGDAGYFIQQATTRHDTGRGLYSQLEFAYGPLLLLPEVWLAALLHCGMTTAYFITLVLSESFGLLLLAFVLNELPIRASLRRAALGLFAFGAITPLMGLNYTFLRFVPAMAVLLYATRSRSPWRCALLLSAGEVLVLLLSPELGLALAVGTIVFALVRARQEGRIWLATAALPLLALGTLLLTLGRPYLRTMASFSGGVLNLPVAPYPHLLVLLIALAWVLPVGLARNMDLHDPLSARLLGFYALGLAYLPAALGRCDPLHVFFNGTALLVLSLAAIGRSRRPVRRAWLACVVVLVLWEHVVNDRLYEYRTAEVLGHAFIPHLPLSIQDGIVHLVARRSPAFAAMFLSGRTPECALGLHELESFVGSGPVVTPLEVCPAIREGLRASHHAQPGYYGYFTDVLTASSEEKAIAEFNTATWALLPNRWEGLPIETPANLQGVQGFIFPYHLRHAPPYLLGKAFKKNVALHWTAVRGFGEYTLYRNQEVHP